MSFKTVLSDVYLPGLCVNLYLVLLQTTLSSLHQTACFAVVSAVISVGEILRMDLWGLNHI